MYEKFYGFKERPFNMTPDSRFFFKSEKHEEALSHLLVAISQRNGFAVITGEVGSGKTTVTRTLLRRLDEETKVALILNTHLSQKELLTSILEDFGVQYKNTSKTALLSALNAFLLEQAEDEKNVVIIIDEAQNLKPSVLEEVRMLSNLETEEEKLLQIILIGQPELRKKLRDPKLRQFTQRIVFYYHLEPLNHDETVKYINHRIKTAGCAKESLFTPMALELIHKYSSGIPRMINLLCHNALINGLVADTSIINAGQVESAAKQLMHNIYLTSSQQAEEKIIDFENTIVNS